MAGNRPVRFIPAFLASVVPATSSTAICSGLPVNHDRAELFAISGARDILTPGWGPLSVSEDIKLAVQRQGYYMRKLRDLEPR